MKGANNCAYVTSFDKGRGHFGDYSCAYKPVLSCLFDEVIEVNVSDVFKGEKATDLVERHSSINGGVAVIHVEFVRFHVDAFRVAKLLQARYPQAKMVATVHDPPAPFINMLYAYVPIGVLRSMRFFRIIDCSIIGNFLAKKIINSLDGVVFLSDAGLKSMLASCPISGIKTSIPHPLLCNAAGEFPAVNMQPSLTICLVGGWWHHKGVVLFIDALKLWAAANEGREMTIHISGTSVSDAYRREIEQRFDSLPKSLRVILHGFQEFHEIQDIANQSDAWIIPYLKTDKVACSGIMNLAIALNSSVICSDLPQFTEIIEDGVNGYTFETGCPKALASVFDKLSDKGKLRSMRKSLWEGYRQSLKPENVAKLLADSGVYGNLAT